LWQAQQLASRSELAPEDFQRLHSHLRYAVQLDGNDPDARAMLAMYYIRMDRWPQALEHLNIAARQRPDMLLLLARAYALNGNTVRGKYFGERAAEYHKQQCELKPRDVAARLTWADSVTFLEDFPKAVAILTEGLTLKDELVYRQALARVYVTWSDTVVGDTTEARLQRLKLVEAGISAYPDDIMLFDRMMAVLRRKDDVSGTAREFLVARIARGEAVVVSHLLLGTDEGELGHYDQAIKHLEQAYNLDPNAPIVANNLAWYLLNNEDIDLDRAYDLVSALAERWPLMAAIHDTRGQILAKMGRWDEALVELQKGLVQMRGRKATHEAMAEVCTKLGMTEIAAEHRKIVARLEASEN
jgi:tetratricopeptide (TPR) repeat protein